MFCPYTGVNKRDIESCFADLFYYIKGKEANIYFTLIVAASLQMISFGAETTNEHKHIRGN